MWSPSSSTSFGCYILGCSSCAGHWWGFHHVWWGSHHTWWCSHPIFWGKTPRAFGQVLHSKSSTRRVDASPVSYFSQGVIPLHSRSIRGPTQLPNHPVPGSLGFQQALLWRSLPAQGCPPCCGAGLEQCRLRRDVPAWHGDQPDQQLQRPSISPPGDTQQRKGKTNKKKKISGLAENSLDMDSLLYPSHGQGVEMKVLWSQSG